MAAYDGAGPRRSSMKGMAKYKKVDKAGYMRQMRAEGRMKARTSGGISRMPAALITMPAYSEEKKFVDIQIGSPGAGIPPSSDGSFALINGVVLGSGFWNRIGSKITMKSAHVRLQCYPRQSPNEDPNEIIRFSLIYDRNPNGAYPTLSTIFSDYTKSGSNTTTVMSGINPTNSTRFIILRDEFVSVLNLDGASELEPIAEGLRDTTGLGYKNWYVKLKDLETVYGSDGTGTIANINAGALYLVVFTNILDTTNPTPPPDNLSESNISIYGTVRLRFMG